MQNARIVNVLQGGGAPSKLKQGFAPISHCGNFGILRGLIRRFYKLVIARPKAEAIQEKRSRTNLWFSVMTCGWWNVPKYVIAHLLRNLWIASSQAPRNDGEILLSNPLIRHRNDINGHSEGGARRIPFNKRSFAVAQDDGKKRSFGFHPQNDIEKQAAFTLAEVLITLGIIGIVAAMTLPTLLSNVQDKILESESKKAANIVANGYKLMMAHDEIFRISDIPFWNCNSIECVSVEHKKVFNISNDNQAVLENLKNVKYYNSKNQAIPFSWEREPVYAFITTDGFAYGVLQPDFDALGYVNTFDIIADVNANNNPNRVAKDLHKYRFSGEGGQLFDVTDELEQVSECSIDNPEGCTTREECFSLPTGVGVCAQWKNNKCSIINNCAV